MKNGFEIVMDCIPAPMSEHIEETIQKCNLIPKRQTRSNLFSFMLEQIYFLKAKNWFVCLFITFFGSMFVSVLLNRKLLTQVHILLGLIPVLIQLVMIPILLKSVDYQTLELENVTYHRYKDLLICRIVLIGIAQLLQISILMFVSYGQGVFSLLQILLYTLVPFNLVTMISFLIMICVHNRQCIYYCVISNVFFSILLFVLSNSVLYVETALLLVWQILFVVSLFFMIGCVIYFLHQQGGTQEITIERSGVLWN